MSVRTGVIEETFEAEATREEGARWLCWILNNDVTPFVDVVVVLMCATHCDFDEAYAETWEAHMTGKAVCHIADEAECRRVARAMETIGVQTEVTKEWE